MMKLCDLRAALYRSPQKLLTLVPAAIILTLCEVALAGGGGGGGGVKAVSVPGPDPIVLAIIQLSVVAIGIFALKHRRIRKAQKIKKR